MSSLPPSPVALAFYGIRWDDPLPQLRLTDPERALLRSAERAPLADALSKPRGGAAYARSLLKVLAEASGPRGPSARVSRLGPGVADEATALAALAADPMGVATHYAVARLMDVATLLGERGDPGSGRATLGTTFYGPGGALLDEWRTLLRVMHLGGAGDPFAQRECLHVCPLLDGA